MTVADSQSISRTAQRLVVEAKRAQGSPPTYGPTWEPIWAAKVDRVDIASGATPSTATIWFPALRWQEGVLKWADAVRIRTDETNPAERTVIFSGFVTSYMSDFSGGTEKTKAFERCAVVCRDYRWLLSVTSPVFGQAIRGPDDYVNFGTPLQAPIDHAYSMLSGRRAIFNIDGKPNRDPVDLKVLAPAGATLCYTPIFLAPNTIIPNHPVAGEPYGAVPWTAKDMIRYILSPDQNNAYQYLTITNPASLTGLSHPDWSRVLNHIVIDGLNALDAIEVVCKNLGWSFREDYDGDGNPNIVFYKLGAASAYTRSSSNPTILHSLHAPAVAESVDTAVAEGKKMLWSMTLAEDIAAVVNDPWGLGAPQRFEFTAELVPAWLDSDLTPDTANNNANLFKTESDLQAETNPNQYSFYKYYHSRGSLFKRDVGRKWTLNESGRYSLPNYDRGMPFDFAGVIPARYILDDAGKRLYAPAARCFLPCLTRDKDDLNPLGITIEFSFDGGSTWQRVPGGITALKDEAGICVAEPNLAEMVDQAEGAISGGPLDGVQLNYWTSLCDDKLNGRSFKDGDWKTRVRVTASVQMDERLYMTADPSGASGSPFHHAQVYDFSAKYHLNQRTESSQFDGGGLPSRDADDSVWFANHLDAIRKANEDMSVSGQFTLERLWLGDGAGSPDFAVGDCVERITGREHSLKTQMAGTAVYPEIVKIIYLPDKQKTKLITRDLRFAEVAIL